MVGLTMEKNLNFSFTTARKSTKFCKARAEPLYYSLNLIKRPYGFRNPVTFNKSLKAYKLHFVLPK